MKNSQKIVNKTKEILKNDLRYFKHRPRHRSAAEFVEDNSSGITSWSSKASMQYRKFNAEALVLRALKGISDRNGSSVVAIKKYITNHYPYVDGKFTLSVIRNIIRKALRKGKVVQSQGSTLDGLFKISADEIRVEQQQEQFKHFRECMKQREQQKLEMEARINKCRAKEEKRRKVFEQKLAAQLKRQKEAASAAKARTGNLTVSPARDLITFMQEQQKSSSAMLAPAKLRLGAGTSKTFPQKPQIVDYADAALETAKVISSEQLRHAIIKNAEYTPYFSSYNYNDSKPNTHRSMPIKYERTIRGAAEASVLATSTTRSSVFKSKPKIMPTTERLKFTEFKRNNKLVTDAVVNFPPPSTVPVVRAPVVRSKGAVAGGNLRKVIKRGKR